MQTHSHGAQNSVLLRNARGYTTIFLIIAGVWEYQQAISSFFIRYLTISVSAFAKIANSFLLSCYICKLHNGKTWDKNMKIPVGSAGSLHPPERNSSSCLPYEGLPNTTYGISWVLPHFVPFSHTAR